MSDRADGITAEAPVEEVLAEQVDGNGTEALAEDGERAAFVETPFIRSVLDRALSYAQQGLAVHLRGPTGCGKTTLALRLGEELGRPIMLITGDDEFSTSDLVGGEHGYTRRRSIDNFIHSVMKTEDRVDYRWVDARLTVACQQGHTLIYDEFNRSRPEANNVFLPVLEERLLILPTLKTRKGYSRVHPEFTAVFTSNPKEYAGVHSSQDALLDRMITLDLSHFDRETEVAIAQARSGLSQEPAERIVDLVRGLREQTKGACDPSVRSCAMIAEIMARQSQANGAGLAFGQVCLDALSRELSPGGTPDAARRKVLIDLIQTTPWS